jgi:ketosteroid isomerase-like protein
MQVVLKAAALALAVTLGACATPAPEKTTPQATVDGLLAADRTFSAASAKTDLVTGISAMFDADVLMPLPTSSFAHGKAAAVEGLKSNALNLTSKADWTPIRGAISADGQQGFTMGFITTTRANGEVVPGKYMSYWIKRPEGWRVAAYKRAPRPAGDISLAVLPASLPAHFVAPTTDAAARAANDKSLIAAEKSFSDESQTIGLGPAFAKYGREDAANMGGGPGYTLSAKEIAGGFGPTAADPAAINWSSEGVIVASSGDLGLSWGFIRRNAGDRPANAFYTIWRRDSPTSPWRYIAE